MEKRPEKSPFSKYAQEIDIFFHPAIRSSSLLENVRKSLGKMGEALKNSGCELIGHVKVFLESENNGYYFLSLTSFDQSPSSKGKMSEAVSRVKITINAIVFGMDENLLGEMIKHNIEEEIGFLQIKTGEMG